MGQPIDVIPAKFLPHERPKLTHIVSLGAEESATTFAELSDAVKRVHGLNDFGKKLRTFLDIHIDGREQPVAARNLPDLDPNHRVWFT